MEVMTGYSKKIAPSVGARSLLFCAIGADNKKTICSIPGHHKSQNEPNAKSPYDEECTYAGLKAYDTKRPYDKDQFLPGKYIMLRHTQMLKHNKREYTYARFNALEKVLHMPAIMHVM